MKQKKDNYVTRSELKKELKEFKEELREEFATKVDLNNAVKSLKDEINDGLENVIEVLDERNREYRDQILTTVSNFGGRVEKLEEENVVGANQISQVRDTLKKYDVRITKLEKTAKN